MQYELFVDFCVFLFLLLFLLHKKKLLNGKRQEQVSYLETPCFTRTPGTGGGGSSASLRASSVGGGGATVPAAVGVEPIDLALGLPLPLDLGLPGGGGREEGAGDTLFSFSS